MTVSPARSAALETLTRVRVRSAWSSPSLESVLSASALTTEDRSLATRLVYGTLQAEGVLDQVIDARLERPGRLESRIRDILRIACFEILYSRTPPHAVVHQAVEAVRAHRPQATGLANAVLRRIATDAPEFPWGDPTSDRDALARATGHPRWIVDLFLEDLGETRGREALASGLDPAPTYLRHNPFVASLDTALALLVDDGAEPRPSPPDPACVRAGVPGAAHRGRAVARDYFYPQDAAAGVAALAVGPHPGGLVIDLCAGRGGKTISLQAAAVAAGSPADVQAVELHPARAAFLSQRMHSLGVPNVTIHAADATDPDAIEGISAGSADAVLVDAPCTGLGTLRRYPEKRWRISLADLETLPLVQGALLASAARLVRPGGLVVYSTCSVAVAENTRVVQGFLGSDEGRGFVVESLAGAFPSVWHEFLGPDGTFQSWPTIDGPDGHYVAALRRTS